MSQPSDEAPTDRNFFSLFRLLLSRRMLVIFLLGFSSGLPIMILYQSLKVWLRREGIELSTIGYASWITIPYSINFLWAPLLDWFAPKMLGRRRFWILTTQVGLSLSIGSLFFFDPSQSLLAIILLGILICIFSATQDIAVDAYRREILPDRLLGAGAALGVYGYRIGMFVASGLGLWVVDPDTLGLSFQQSFLMIACFFLIGMVATLVAQEPENEIPTDSGRGWRQILAPLKELLLRKDIFIILSFIFLYKFGDAFAGTMLSPYYVDLGFSNKEIAEIPRTLGMIAGFVGMALGGVFIFRFGILSGLWVAGILQAASTFSLSWLSQFPHLEMLTFVVAFEDVSSGMGTAALVAFMSQMTDRRFTATQYALMASIASLGRTFFAGYAGVVLERLDYQIFFLVCSLAAIPGLFCLYAIQKREPAK